MATHFDIDPEMNDANQHAEDAARLRDIVQKLYATVSAPAGVAPPIAGEARFLHPEARKCRTERTAEGEPRYRIMSGAQYAENVLQLITEHGFFEIEVAHESFVYGHIAHVISHYEGYSDAELTQRVKKGVNSIQFLRVDGEWKVYSMIWDDEESFLRSSGPSSTGAEGS